VGSKLYLRCNDYRGIPVVFTEVQRALKSEKHPELRDASFVERIKKALQSPHFIYPDLTKKKRFAYYYIEYSINGRKKYTKVILQTQVSLCFIVTAFRPDYVKERGKVTPIYGKDEN